jgi:hypothetical protein
MWLETTSKNSFDVSTPTDESTVTGGSDINLFQMLSNRYDASGTVSQYVSDGINGLPSLKFDGIDDTFNTIQAFQNQTPFTLFIVEKFDDLAGSQYMFRGNSVAGDNMLYLLEQTGVGLAAGSLGFSIASDTDPHIYTLTSSGGSSSFLREHIATVYFLVLAIP